MGGGAAWVLTHSRWAGVRGRRRRSEGAQPAPAPAPTQLPQAQQPASPGEPTPMARVAMLAEQNAYLEEVIRQQKAQAAAAAERHAAALAAAHTVTEALERERGQMQAIVLELQERLTQYEQQLAALREERATWQATAAALEQRRAEVEAVAAELRQLLADQLPELLAALPGVEAAEALDTSLAEAAAAEPLVGDAEPDGAATVIPDVEESA